ncbi:DNA polymerase III subunit gamma/tau [Candidatus Bipolaricaulota bacterium]|nr:DNA polymerase III subunit gamma/tau [Candidatus Bipolaricaulota bacterium]
MTENTSRLSLYRQWRSQTFAEIVGQEAIVQTLRNAVIAQEVAHAYLFSGERGIGKTSIARILARAVNCLNSVNGEPCNQCANCKAILTNRSLDIVEIDGASNRGIDHIRQLRDEVNFAPTDLKRKVYIIDEVHMLTNEAFNALLKTLEEPPAHAMFMFATTEPHKVPRTIISRCQAFDFRRIAPQLIANHMAVIAQSLQIEISSDALALIAHRANGGMRDALVMLEQVASYGGTAIAVDTVLDMLGLADRSVHESFLQAIETQDQTAIMGIIDQLVERGKDLEIFLSDVIALLRDRLGKPSPTMSMDIRIARRLLDIKADLFRSLDRRILLEIGVLALIESLAAPSPATTVASPKPGATKPVATTAKPIRTAQPGQTSSAATTKTDQTRPQTQAQTPAPQPDAPVKQPTPKQSMPSAAVNTLAAEYKSQWESMLQEIQQDRIAIAAFLIEGSPAMEADRLIISFHPEHSFHKASLEMRDNLPYLAGAVRRHFGDHVRVDIKTDDTVSRKPLPHELLMEKARMVCEAVDGKIVKEDW